MKIFKNTIAYLAVFALLFTSCSKEETDVSGLDSQETFQIQFGTLLSDFNNQSKDHLSDDPVECRVADPSYVLVALTDSDDQWVAGMNPEAVGADASDFIKIDLKNNSGTWETEYSSMLGLPAGTYQLEYFIVYSADDQVLWVAPRLGGAYADTPGVDPLPQEIVLGAGTKPYIEVDVLCFIPRVEDAFGYVFFEINPIPITNNYCFFVNYCDDGTGREYPAKFQVDIWGDDYNGDDVIISGEMNSVSGEGNAFAATVLCVPLPPLADGEVYYARVTVLDAGAYDADALDFEEFTISQADIDAQLLATPKYEHVRINCGDDGSNGNGECDPANPDDDCDGDGVLNGIDECVGGTIGNVDEVGCPIKDPCDLINNPELDCDGDGISNAADQCEGFDDSLDFDGDLLPDGCDPDDDDDGILDGDENAGCRLNPDVNCGETPTTCSISERSGCTMGSTDGTLLDVSVGDFIDISAGDATIAQGSIIVIDGKVNVSVSPGLNLYISDYEIELQPEGVDTSTTICAEGLSAPDGGSSGIQTTAFDYDPAATYSIRIKVNVCAR